MSYPFRIALLTYCQAVEMTAPHVLLANLLNIAGGKPYVIAPFHNLSRRKKKDILSYSYVPPVLGKIRHIKSLAEAIGETHLVTIFDSFFDDRVRNAFSHSDYILTDKAFRWTEGGPASQMDPQGFPDGPLRGPRSRYPPAALPYPILSGMSRPCLAAPRLAARRWGVRPLRAGGAALAVRT